MTGTRAGVTAGISGIAMAALCCAGGTAASTANLKPFDPVALQGVVEATAKELLLPGAMVLLRTPQGDFAFGYGAPNWAARPRRAPIRISGSPRTPRR